MEYTWYIKDTDKKQPCNLKSRIAQLVLATFPYYPGSKLADNKEFCRLCFTFMKDYSLLNENNVAFLQDFYKCINEKIAGLKVDDNKFCVLRESIDSEEAKIRYYSDCFVECNGKKYYVLNYWFLKDSTDQGKWGFVKWIIKQTNTDNDFMKLMEELYNELYKVKQKIDKAN